MSKNLCPENNITFENSQTIRFDLPLDPGTYTSSAVVESTDTDSSVCLMLFYYSDGGTKEVYINRSASGKRVSKTAEFTAPVTRVRIYASEGYNPSVGDTATFTQLQIEVGDVATDYVPYGDELEAEEYEVVAYYKALSGETVELPAPSCRETHLLKRLLDTSYAVPFTASEESSRVEEYLWDLVNGTTVMLSNIPKSDKEKYLHIAIGGTVSEMPNPEDCELNYWMNQWLSNRS